MRNIFWLHIYPPQPKHNPLPRMRVRGNNNNAMDMICRVCVSVCVACAQGFFGDGCTTACQCRNASECDHISGSCTCQAGFTGITCHGSCPSGFYGLGCGLTCQCFTAGTRSCDPIAGSCDCREMWIGLLCDIEGVLANTLNPSSFYCLIMFLVF